jgi:hypothetical protein
MLFGVQNCYSLQFIILVVGLVQFKLILDEVLFLQ